MEGLKIAFAPEYESFVLDDYPEVDLGLLQIRTMYADGNFSPDFGKGGSVIEESKLTRAQRAADAVTEFCGSWPFIIVFSGITLVWMAYNTFQVFHAFDPYPYILLNLFLTVISTFQSPLIMMSQNRQMERDRDAVKGLHAKLDGLYERLPSSNPLPITIEHMKHWAELAEMIAASGTANETDAEGTPRAGGKA